MVKRVLVALFVLLAIIAAIFYYQLGGGRPLEFQLITHPDFYIIGKHFEGKFNDPKLEGLFFDARRRAEENPDYALTIINFPGAEPGKTLKQFIGAGSQLKPVAFDSLEIIRFPRHEAVTTIISSHNFVMPTPEEVREEATEFARENGYRLDTISYEVYISDRELRVSFPVKKE